MYAVIFKATINNIDDEYNQTAQRMRELAFNQYNCKDFISTCENNKEISISYWDSLEDIQRWKQNSEHQKAQTIGKEKWYSSYNIEIVEVIKKLSSKDKI